MNRAKKSRKNLSWQAARQKITDRLFFPSNKQCNYMNYRIATNAFGKETNVLGQPHGIPQVAHTDSILSVIHQMVDIMDKLGCNDLEALVHEYVNTLINN